MKIHLNQIPATGLHLEGEEEGNVFDFRDELVRVLSPVRYSVDVGLSEGGLFATGSLAVDLELECVCCLEWFRHTLEVPDFATQVELGTSESVDLTEEVREDILLALPPNPRCDLNGGKACAGVRITTTITESPTETEPGGANPWATLDQLNQLTKPKDR